MRLKPNNLYKIFSMEPDINYESDNYLIPLVIQNTYKTWKGVPFKYLPFSSSAKSEQSKRSKLLQPFLKSLLTALSPVA